MPKKIRELIGKNEVQQATGCHFNTFDRYERAGKFPNCFYAPSGHRKWYLDEIEMWVSMNLKPRTADNSRAIVGGKPVQGGSAPLKGFEPCWDPAWMAPKKAVA